MNNNIFRWIWIWRWTPGALSIREHETPNIIKEMEFSILGDQYGVINPFVREGQDGPPTLPPYP